MPDFDTDVLVVGAGPTGLTMAVELARRGIACRIVDQAARAATESRALGIHARTLETFDLMGVLPGFLERGHIAHGVRMIAEGKPIFDVRLDEIDSAHPFVLILAQSETERLLTGRLTGLGVSVERGAALTTFTQDADGVTAAIRQGDGTEGTTRARWIVGCDGAHSAVRHTLGLKFEGAPYPEEFVLADVDVDWEFTDEELLIFLSDAGLAAFFPMGGRLWRVVAASPGPAAAGSDDHGIKTAQVSLEDVRAMIASRVGMKFEVSNPVWTARFRVHRRIVEQMRVGRAFLAGDAADIHSPAGGQGMNTGIQSAHNLAWKLAMVVSGHAPESLLDSYQAERHPVEEDVLRGTDFLTRLVTATNPLVHKLRDILAPVLVRQDFVQHRITSNVSEVAVAYRRSPIVEEHSVADSKLRAGDHAPDFRIYPVQGGTPDLSGSGTTLAGVLDPSRYTLFVLTGPVVERPRGSSGDTQATGEAGLGRLFPSYSGLGGASPFPAEPGVPLEGGPAADGLYRVVDAGKRASERYSDSVRCHLIARDVDQGYGFDWPCETWLDKDAALHERYGSSTPSLYLIRPDGYIAFRSGPADAERLLEYLNRTAAPVA